MAAANAQTTYLPLGSDEYALLGRLETKSGQLSNRLFLNVSPVSRKDAVEFLLLQKSNFLQAGLTNIDNYNINRALSISGEWKGEHGDGALNSAHPIWNTFYKKQPDFVYVNTKGFFLSVNPVLSLEAYRDDPGKLRTNASQGLELRGRAGNAVGFYFYGAHDRIDLPGYAAEWFGPYESLGNTGPGKVTDRSYFDLRGYIDLGLIKNHVNLTIGYDKHFIGDGQRSLFLSDFSSGAAFARLSTKIWKLEYQNLYLSLKPQSVMDAPSMQSSKFATVHYLSVNPTRWLNLGFFEAVTLSRNNGVEWGYFNPIIFYRAVERYLGSPDKVSIGFSAKALLLRKAQLYGQFLINEFTLKELTSNRGYWANKWGVQAGARYFDAFLIPNLDLQAEINIVRPYTYQHYSDADGLSMANYSHGNLPLAHPLGAGFIESNASLRYQPMPRLLITARGMLYRQGVDTGNANMGNIVLKNYNLRPSNYGVSLIHGLEGKCLLADLQVAYELRPRLYLQVGATYRKYSYPEHTDQTFKTFAWNAGVRLNMSRKEYVQF